MAEPILPLGPIARSRTIKRRYLAWLQDTVHGQPEAARFCAATLTLKQGIMHSGALELLDRDKTSKCLQQSLARLNSEVFGNAYRRYAKKLLCFPVIERTKLGERWHVHMILQIPAYMRDKEFFKLFAAVWRKNEWSQSQFKIEPLPGHDVKHWAKYCLKDFVMDDETIDIPNVHISR
jgi:hypothetical protein